MKSQTNYLRPVLIAFAIGVLAIIEVFLIPGIWAKLGIVFALIVGVTLLLVRQYGGGVVRRSLGAIVLGGIFGLITFSMVGGCLCFLSAMAICLKNGQSLDEGYLALKGWSAVLVIVSVLCVLASAIGFMSRYSAPLFIRRSFVAGTLLWPLSLLSLYIFQTLL